jgi:hypothetical protein
MWTGSIRGSGPHMGRVHVWTCPRPYMDPIYAHAYMGSCTSIYMPAYIPPPICVFTRPHAAPCEFYRFISCFPPPHRPSSVLPSSVLPSRVLSSSVLPSCVPPSSVIPSCVLPSITPALRLRFFSLSSQPQAISYCRGRYTHAHKHTHKHTHTHNTHTYIPTHPQTHTKTQRHKHTHTHTHTHNVNVLSREQECFEKNQGKTSPDEMEVSGTLSVM